MTKIQRTTQKIFGGNAPVDDIAVLGSFKTGTPVYTDDIAALQNTAYEEGYGAALVANEAPFMEEQNSIPYILSKQLAYNFQEGVAEYDANTTYYIGSIVKVLDEENKPLLYYSVIDNNLNNPLTDDTKWQKVELGGGGGSDGLNLFDIVKKDYVLNFEESKGLALLGTYVYKTPIAGSRYGYPDFYNKCLEEKNAGAATQVTLGDNVITMYINTNGHQFYNIADKAAIDAWYDTYGIAWYYGIDEENERIFLPKGHQFLAFGDTDALKTKVYGDGQTLGLLKSDGTGYGTGFTYNQGTIGMSCYSNLYGKPYTTSSPSGNPGATVGLGVTNDPTKSGLIGTTDLSSNGIEAYVYMVVGNTEQTSSITDVVDVTTSENDTIPLGYSTYQGDGAQPSASWLASSGQWNSGDVYSTFYNEYVSKIGQEFAGGYVRNHMETYDDFDLVINQDDMTFRLPLLNGSEDIPSDKYDNLELKASDEEYIAPANGWVTFQKQSNVANHYIQIFDTTNKRSTISRTAGTSNTAIAVVLFVKKDTTYKVNYNTTGITQIFTFTYAKGSGTLYFKVANAVQNLELLDVGTITGVLSDKIGRQECKAYITDTYVNGTSGYNIYSNGYCEQWGQSTVQSKTINFLKTFKDISYNVLTTGGVGTTTKMTYMTIIEEADSKTVNSITFKTYTPGTTSGVAIFYWRATGYLAEGEY